MIIAPGSPVPDGSLRPLSYSSTGNGATIDTSRYDVAQTASRPTPPSCWPSSNRQPPAPTPTSPTTGTPGLQHRQPLRRQPLPGQVLHQRHRRPGRPLLRPRLLALPGGVHRRLHHPDDPTSSSYGQVTAAGPDGIPDFQVVNGIRQIRWYGLARSTSGDPTGNINASHRRRAARDTLRGRHPLARRQFPNQPAGQGTRFRALRARDARRHRLRAVRGHERQRPLRRRLGRRHAVHQPADPHAHHAPLHPHPRRHGNRTGAGQTFEYVVQLPQ